MPSACATALSASLSNSTLSIVPTFRNGGGDDVEGSGGKISSTCIVPAACATSASGGAVQHAQTTGCYTDSSGRSRIRLLLRLDFGSAEEIDAVVDSGCLVPPPPSAPNKTAAAAADGEGNDQSKAKKKNKRKGAASLKFECAPVHRDESQSNPISVESIAVQSTHINTSDPEDCAILFVVEVAVRSTEEEDEEGDDDYTEDGEVKSEDDDGRAATENGHGGNGGGGEGRTGRDGGQLQIRAVLSERVPSCRNTATIRPSNVPIGLLALELGSGFGGGGGVGSARLASASATASEDATGSASASTVHYSTLHTRTRPVNLTLNLVEPLAVTVREVGGARAASGATLVSVTVSHSNQHDEDVTVTNLAIHPGHSRPWNQQMAAAEFQRQQGRGLSSGRSRSGNSVASNSLASSTGSRASVVEDATVSPSGSHLHNTSILAGHNAVLDLSTSARWGYAPGTAPSLPLLLKPRESVATVLQIDAGENLRTRGYISPVAVTAVVGAKESDAGDAGGATAASGELVDPIKTLAVPVQVPVMVSTDARWTTARLAVEPADAFRVDLSLVGSASTCKVGAPVVVSLRVMNLSSETKDLMLLMAKDEESSRDKDGGGLGFGGFSRQYRKYPHGSSSASVQSFVTAGSVPLVGGRPYSQPHSTSHGVNTAVVSEVNGYTFGVWGLSGDDDGTSRHNRDHELLAVDAALLLGEVKAQHAIEAELRFVPLREGTLDVPNLKLYDKLGGRWYNTIHLLKLVATASA